MPTGSLAIYPIRKTADQSVTSSTTLADDTILQFPVLASHNYQFRCVAPFALAGALSGFKLQISVPSSPTSYLCYAEVVNAVTGAIALTNIATSVSTLAGSLATMGDHMAMFEGVLENGVNAGVIKLQFAQNTSDSAAITIKRNAMLFVIEVG